jgi:hypothetical protein
MDKEELISRYCEDYDKVLNYVDSLSDLQLDYISNKCWGEIPDNFEDFTNFIIREVSGDVLYFAFEYFFKDNSGPVWDILEERGVFYEYPGRDFVEDLYKANTYKVSLDSLISYINELLEYYKEDLEKLVKGPICSYYYTKYLLADHLNQTNDFKFIVE